MTDYDRFGSTFRDVTDSSGRRLQYLDLVELGDEVKIVPVSLPANLHTYDSIFGLPPLVTSFSVKTAVFVTKEHVRDRLLSPGLHFVLYCFYDDLFNNYFLRLHTYGPLSDEAVYSAVRPKSMREWLGLEVVPARDPRFPHDCPRCSGPAFVGLNQIECREKSCFG